MHKITTSSSLSQELHLVASNQGLKNSSLYTLEYLLPLKGRPEVGSLGWCYDPMVI